MKIFLQKSQVNNTKDVIEINTDTYSLLSICASYVHETH